MSYVAPEKWHKCALCGTTLPPRGLKMVDAVDSKTSATVTRYICIDALWCHRQQREVASTQPPANG